MESKRYTWTTGYEKEFINGLGKHSKCGVSKKELLQKYIKIAEQRESWGIMNNREILRYAKATLGLFK